MGCWDYYGPDHTRTTRHDGPLLNLVQELLKRDDLNIDPNQVYITGLSSGGGEAMVMGCLAPDIFAGVGIDAGPSVGTSSSQYQKVSTDQSTVVQVCKALAGGSQAQLATQVTSVVYGTADYTVDQKYGDLNAASVAEIYGASQSSGSSGLPGEGTQWLWTDSKGPRVSLVSVVGLGHAWPAGAGLGDQFIDNAHLNYPEYLTEFLFANNRRVERLGAPLVTPGPTPVPAAKPIPMPAVGVTATLCEHIKAGRLSFVDYATYYLKHGDHPFTLYRWRTENGQMSALILDWACITPTPPSR